MRTLAIDTACMTATCAVLENGAVLAEYALHGARTHSQKLLPMVSSMLESLALSPADMDIFAVSMGPGSFTGLRIGIVTAKGLAFATGKQCVGVHTLEALAYTVPFFDGVVCPVLDARNLQAFCGFYDRREREVSRLLDDGFLHVDALADALAGMGRNVLLVGDVSDRFLPLIQARWAVSGCGMAIQAADFALFSTRAAAVALLAERQVAAGDPGDAFALEAFYLRPSQAERYRQAKSEAQGKTGETGPALIRQGRS